MTNETDARVVINRLLRESRPDIENKHKVFTENVLRRMGEVWQR